jgi:hypothetical protein
MGPLALLLLFLCLSFWYCCCGGWNRASTRSRRDTARGEYRRVASRFTADAFDDTIQEEEDDGYDDDDDDDDEYGMNNDGYRNGSKHQKAVPQYTNGKHVIEMKELDKGRLTLKEVNG